MHSPEQPESGVMELDGTGGDKTWRNLNFFGGDVCNGDRDDGGGGGAAAAKVRDRNSNLGACPTWGISTQNRTSGV